jgi:hypothetical protein
MPDSTQTSSKGVSLSRGPALILGGVLLVAGLFFLYKSHAFPRLGSFPNGTAHVDVKAFFGVFGINGWSGELTAAAGGLLLIGAAQHLLAKAASLIVAVALGGVAVWALVNHHSALGLFAANIWTIIGWGGAAALLFLNTLLPRPAGSSATAEATQPGSARPVTSAPPARPAAPPSAQTPVRVEPIAGQASEPDTEVTQTPPGVTSTTREL